MVIPVGGNSESYGRQVSLWWKTANKVLTVESFFFYLFSLICKFAKLLKDTILKGRLHSPLKVVKQFHEAGFIVDFNDDQGSTLNKKIRSAQLAQYNYIFGKDEYWKQRIKTDYTKCFSPLMLHLLFLPPLYQC